MNVTLFKNIFTCLYSKSFQLLIIAFHSISSSKNVHLNIFVDISSFRTSRSVIFYLNMMGTSNVDFSSHIIEKFNYILKIVLVVDNLLAILGFLLLVDGTGRHHH